ncbi:acyltransferase [Vibrio fortis]|uniref:Acyltransferase n=1 Tax=Vibrio fortis TaxID=212667 RepID=A0A5N3S8S2_9VIBR|nr:acyltransferase [Vibrio fortis]KAB0302253.1 acyltransferase [Vibrio fortis]
MKNVISFLYKLWLKVKFGQRLSIASDVIIPWQTIFIIDAKSKIKIMKGCVLRPYIELRATNNSSLILGDNVKLDKSIRMIATNQTKIHVGANCKIGLGTVFNGGGNINIGEKTLISGYVYIQTSMHNHSKETDIIDSGYIYGDINIERGSWLGVHSVIFPNVNLGERTIVGSNAVVNRSFENGSIIGGIPAKRIR